jgi:hypothetical protein
VQARRVAAGAGAAVYEFTVLAGARTIASGRATVLLSAASGGGR